MLAAQAQAGPTPRARFDAISALAQKDRAAARDALKSILIDEGQHYSFRIEAANALGAMQQPSAQEILFDALQESHAIKQPKVRRAAVEALGKYRDTSAATTLLRFAKSDPSYEVEGQATASLGKQDASEPIVAQLLENFKKPSYRDRIRLAALDALADLGEPRGIEPAKALAAYGQPYRSRPRAIEALAKLAQSQDQKTQGDVRKFLVGLIDDPQDRAAVAAIRALGEIGDEKAIDDLRKFADSAAKERLHRETRGAIDRITKHNGESSALKDLRQRVESLEKAQLKPTTRETK
jgi:HEAT repeat protein